jgi:predicted transcriptional regulator of viral defense system
MAVKNRSEAEKELIDPVLEALNRHKLLTHAELVKTGASGVKLRRMTEAGLMTAVGSGIYASVALDPFVAAVLATAKYYPQTVISGLTGLHIHGLSQEYVEKIDIDIPRETNLRNKIFQVHRVPTSRLVGIEDLRFHGSSIRIYNRERTLCEAYRLDRAGPLFFKALKRYVGSGKLRTDLIQKYDQALKTRVLMHLQQELADE